MKRPVLRRRLVFAEHHLIVAVRDVERGVVWVDLDHRAVRVAARRHEGAFERAERKALSAHQFGQDFGYVLRLTRRDRYVMDHANALRYGSRRRRALLCGLAPGVSTIPRTSGAEQCVKTIGPKVRLGVEQPLLLALAS